jgi:hypothetical protein
MRRILAAGAMGIAIMVSLVVSAQAAIHGNYVEVRSADIYAGHCYANSEVGMEGKEAMLAWKIQSGEWQGVDLAGLAVVAVVRASATLGDPYHNPLPARAVLILDAQANAAQRAALTAFAREMAGPLAANIVRVESAPIRMESENNNAVVRLSAGNVARIETRAICHGDHLCGNEFVYYPPLTSISDATPAVSVEDMYAGQGLETVWNRTGRKNSFVGTFNR